jgi:XRE family transcriptional regulator, aerobic/anaerobic benzoate catabolism transcriptional regulator
MRYTASIVQHKILKHMAPTAKSKALSRLADVTRGTSSKRGRPAPPPRSAASARSAASTREFLASLGARVRELRNRRGMIRRILAQQADVSERHLAQLEAGDGNVSVVLLQRIAGALGVSLTELFSPEKELRKQTDTTRERILIERFLERLPAARSEEVMARLMREFGDEERARRNRIALIGIRGAGKSTLGSKLAADWKMPFIELDAEIEKDAGMPLGEIFSLYGQAGYRAIERRLLERVLQEHPRALLSVGGGVVSEKETYDYLLANCYTVWIKARPEEYMARVMAQGDFRVMGGSGQAMEELRRILEARDPLYRKADLVLDTTGNTVEQSFAQLKNALSAPESAPEKS